MDSHKLIEQVKSCPCIYDHSNGHYGNATAKNAAWKQISKEMNQTIQQCKKTWLYLRDAFRRNLKKKRDYKNNRQSISLRKWKYEEEMSFMLPCFKESNLTSETDTCSEFDAVENPETNGNETDGNKENDQCASSHSARSRKSRRHGKDFAKLFMEFLLENNILAKRKDSPPDDVTFFFESMTSTVQGFTPYNRAIAKAKVSSIISELEIRNLSQLKAASSPLAPTRPITPFPQPLPMVTPAMMMPTSESQNMPMSPMPQPLPMSPGPQIRLPCSFPNNH